MKIIRSKNSQVDPDKFYVVWGSQGYVGFYSGPYNSESDAYAAIDAADACEVRSGVGAEDDYLTVMRGNQFEPPRHMPSPSTIDFIASTWNEFVRDNNSRQSNAKVFNITAKKGKYNEVTLEFNPPYTEGKRPDFSYPRGRCTLIGTLYAIGVLDTPIDCWSNSNKSMCESLFDENKDKLFNNIRVPLDRYVNLFDYQLGPYTGSELLGQGIQHKFIDALQNRDYYGIDSLNAPDMYLFRFLCDLVQHQMVDLKITYDKDRSYGVGIVAFEFSIADFNFELVTTGDFSGLYNHIGVNKLVDSWGMIDLLSSLGYKRGSNISGCPKNYLRLFTRVGNSRQLNNVGINNPGINLHIGNETHPCTQVATQGMANDTKTGYKALSISLDNRTRSVTRSQGLIEKILKGEVKDLSWDSMEDFKKGKAPRVNSRQSNSILSAKDTEIADKYVAKANNDNYLDILREIAKELGEHFDVRKKFETPNEFRAWAEENDKISDRMYVVIDYVLGGVTGMKIGVRQSNGEFRYSGAERLLKLGGFALKVCKEILGEDNCLMITRIIDADGQVDIDLGRGVRSFRPSPNSDAFYEAGSEVESKYNQTRVARIIITEGSYEIEGNKGNYFKDFGNNDYVIIPSLKKHLREYVSL